MSEWDPLSVRTGQREKFNLIDGFPSYLQNQVRHATVEALESPPGLVPKIALKLRVAITSDTYRQHTHLWTKMSEDASLALDVYDLLARISQQLNFPRLSSLLDDIGCRFSSAGSVWRFNLKDGRLEHRLPQSALDSYDLATEPEDQISDYVSSAWASAYGRDQEPETAWHDATRALEEALKPIVVPNNSKTTLGAIRDAIKGKPTKWDASMPGDSAEERVGNFLAVLNTLPFAPKRHGGDEKDAPTIEVSRSVVLLATSLVAIVREGGLWRVARA